MGRRKKIKTLFDYLTKGPRNQEIFRFDSQNEADSFANKLREIARKEEDVQSDFDLQLFSIRVTAMTVRVSVLQPELTSV